MYFSLYYIIMAFIQRTKITGTLVAKFTSLNTVKKNKLIIEFASQVVQLHIPQAMVFLNLSPSEGTVLLAIFKLIFTENQGTLCSGCITRELVSDKKQVGLCAKFNGTSQNI